MAVTLFTDKKKCSGCGACVNACPRDAIALVPDEDGFLYPQIDEKRCAECGLCQKVCHYGDDTPKAFPAACYAAAARDDEMLGRSASGGVFAVLARDTLAAGGAVYGAAMSMETGLPVTAHVRIDDLSDLPALQGSKYVHSDTGLTFRQVKADLCEGRRVLYSGTPCQIAGLKGYLGREYEDLLTVELICHGVPSGKMFADFIATLAEKRKLPVTGFHFRTKTRGQSMVSCAEYKKADGSILRERKNGNLYSYMYYFLKSYIYRSNCYSCPYAANERRADITIGDFWGFHEEYPTLGAGCRLNNGRGVSCVLVNSARGREWFREVSGGLELLETEFEKIARHNAQLSAPSSCPGVRDAILEIYRSRGYTGVEQHYRRTTGRKRLAYMVASLVPKGAKRLVKRVIGIVK